MSQNDYKMNIARVIVNREQTMWQPYRLGL